jgi:hypothetical protein
LQHAIFRFTITCFSGGLTLGESLLSAVVAATTGDRSLAAKRKF